MSAYLIVIDTEAMGPDMLSRFRDRITAATRKHGGRHLVRGADIDVVDGDISPQHLVVIEFDDSDQAHEMLKSDVFEELRTIRNTTSPAVMIVQGVEN